MAAKGTLPAKTIVSDEEFIRAWKDCGGHVAKVARSIGIVNERSVYARRRAVEERLGMSLKAGAASATSAVSYHNAFYKTNIENGVVLVGTDPHLWPGERTTCQRAFLHFAEHMEPRPKVIVLNGDVFDGSRVSRHPKIGFLEKRPTVKDELEACQDYLDKIERIAPKGCKLLWPLGNHDLRWEAYLSSAAPEFEGVEGFALKDRFPLWQPCWVLWINEGRDGWTEIKHRFKGGIHATYNNTLRAGVNILTGHLHCLNVRPWTDRKGTRYGIDAGTLADVDGDNISQQFVHYLEGNSVDWRSGFVILTFKDGNLMWPEVVSKWDETHVEFRGQLIQV